MILNFAVMTDHDFIDKKALSERDIGTKYITPAIKDVAVWSITQFYEEFFLGKIHRRGKRVAQLLGWCDALEAQLKSFEEERGQHSAYEPQESVPARTV